MTAKHTIDNTRKLIITTWEGKASDAEFIEAMKKYQREVQGDPAYTSYNELLDFTDLTDIKVTVKGIRVVAKLASRTDRQGPRRKLAIVAPSNTKLFFVRMYMVFRSFTKRSSKDVRIFSNESDALVWIQ